MHKKRYSVFKQLMLIFTAVTVLQAVIFYVAMSMTGVVNSINSNAENALYRNSVKRSTFVRNEMQKKWSGIEEAADSAEVTMKKLLDENDADISDIFTDKMLAARFMEDYSVSLLDMLRMNSVNGAFLIMCRTPRNPSVNDFGSYKGVYFKDSDPDSSNSDYSDLMMMYGSSTISSKYNIPLDMTWQSDFSYESSSDEILTGFFEPVCASYSYPNLDSQHLAYWSDFFSAPDSSNPSERIMTYSVSLFYNGQVYAVIGVSVSESRFLSMLPADEVDADGNGGYMLVRYSTADENQGEIASASVLTMSGDMLEKTVGVRKTVRLQKINKSDVLYYLKGVSAADGKSYCSISEMSVYGDGSPFEDIHWALLAVTNEKSLYGTSESFSARLVVALLISAVIGMIAVCIASARISSPVSALVKSVKNADDNSGVIPVRETSNEDIYQLSTVLNTLSSERNKIENDLRAERERYLIALCNTKNHLIEYDCESDIFTIYNFSSTDTELSQSEHYHQKNYRKCVIEGEVCVNEDIPKLLSFIDGSASYSEFRVFMPQTHELRWYAVNGKSVCNDDGKLVRVVASSWDINDEKLEEQRRFDEEHRDSVTGFYTGTYGDIVLEKHILESSSYYRAHPKIRKQVRKNVN